MLRSVLTLALSVFLLAEASAQTAPATAAQTKAKSAKAAARAAARNAKKSRRVAIKSAPAAPLNDGWPALENTQPAVASTATTADGNWGYGAAATTSRGEIDNANVYAAPGMPVHIRTSKGMVPYSVRPPRKPAAQTTLNPGN